MPMAWRRLSRVHAADVDAVDQDAALARFVQPQQQRQQRRSCPNRTGPTSATRSPAAMRSVHPVEHRAAVGIRRTTRLRTRSRRAGWPRSGSHAGASWISGSRSPGSRSPARALTAARENLAESLPRSRTGLYRLPHVGQEDQQLARRELPGQHLLRARAARCTAVPKAHTTAIALVIAPAKHARCGCRWRNALRSRPGSAPSS